MKLNQCLLVIIFPVEKKRKRQDEATESDCKARQDQVKPVSAVPEK